MGQAGPLLTFVFTDIERSTQRAAALGDERFADALEMHRDLLRDAFGEHRGREVGTEGDSFFVVFDTPQDGISAAVDAQRALASHDWPPDLRVDVRIGVHTGVALVRGNDYIGHDVHKAKRICDAGHGGQVLLSAQTEALVAAETRDLGPHRLKDLGEPQRLYQLAADGLRADFPPLRSLGAFEHNLPLQRTSFVGREREVDEVRALLRANRLVTLTGVGGCGKTRLALQVGAESLDDYPDGVFFVDLAPISDPDLVATSIATAVGLQRAGELPPGADGEPSDEALLSFLTGRKLVVLLDNCEHLLDGCADVADRILARCADVVLLATSREALDVEGEQTWQVPSLSLPQDGKTDSSESVSLFVDRAKAVRPGFELTEQNADAVTQICRRLDGMPLAIEFAAARVSHMPPAEIAERLHDMFRLLTGGRRRAQRQQTLQAALDWSHDLLSDAEQILLRRLAVFNGSFPTHAVEGICAGDEIDPRDVLDVLASLVAKSLVEAQDVAGRARYRLIETVRAYSSEKLREAGEAESFRSRHRDWYLEWVESFSWDDVYLDPSVTLQFEDERANLLAALDWSKDEGRPDLVTRIICRLEALWEEGGPVEETYRFVVDLDPVHVDVPSADRVAAFRLKYWALSALRALSDPAGEMHPTEVDVPTAIDDAVAAAGGEPSSPLSKALFYRAMDRAIRAAFASPADPARDKLANDARRDLEESRRIANELGVGKRWDAVLSMQEGVVELILGSVDAAADALTHGAKVAGTPPTPGFMLDVAAGAHVAGRRQEAIAAAQQWLDLRNAVDERTRGIVSRGRFARVAQWVATPAVVFAEAGDLERARTLLVDALDDLPRWRHGNVRQQELIVGVAGYAFHSGDVANASRLLAWVRVTTLDQGRVVGSVMAGALYKHYARAIGNALGSTDATRYRDEGRRMTEEGVLTLVRALISAPEKTPASPPLRTSS